MLGLVTASLGMLSNPSGVGFKIPEMGLWLGWVVVLVLAKLIKASLV